MKTKKKREPSPRAVETAQTFTPDQFPPEMIEYVRQMALDDGEMVQHCVALTGIFQKPSDVLQLPRAFLLNLAAVHRLLLWEMSGVQIDPRYGLPSAEAARRQICKQACEDPAAAAALPAALHTAVFNYALDHFSWAGPLHIEAEVQLDVPDEDTLIEAFAQFLLSAATEAMPSAGGSES